MSDMEHPAIDASAVPELYVTGRLGPDERSAFEAHLVGCPECVARVEAVEGLAAGLRALELRRFEPPSHRRALPRWAARSGWVLAGATAAAVAVLLWSAAGRRELEGKLATESARVNGLRAALEEATAAAERERVARTPTGPRPEPGSPVQVPVLVLVATRGGDAPTLELPPSPRPVVLLVERESPTRFQSYQVTLRTAGGQEVLHERLAPSSSDTVALAIDSAVLARGEYLLVLEGLGRSGQAVAVARHRIQVVERPRP